MFPASRVCCMQVSGYLLRLPWELSLRRAEMGCVSSKVVTRSRSFQEELSLSLQRRTNGVPALEGLLAKKNGGGDQLMALLCTANTVAAKLRAVNAAHEQDKPSLPPTEPEHDEKASIAIATTEEEPTGPETINTWELMADLDSQEDGEEQVEQESDQTQLQQQHPQELAHSSSLRDGEGVYRARSFRTVDDLDAMVTGDSSPLVFSKSGGIPSNDYPPDSNGQAPVTDAGRRQEPQDNDEEERDSGGTAHQAPGGPDGSHCSVIKAKPEVPDAGSMVLSRSPSTRGEPAGAEGKGPNGVAGARSFTELKGLRRRAMAKELKTLKVPSFEFSSVGSLREWLGGDCQVFSPGSYVTPKFGSFGSETAVVAGGGGDAAEREKESLFDPQLVSDLEEAMERMSMEEEHILRQIVESLQGSLGEDAEG
ncbi:hypothetical protein Taro_012282 [Colocasia esculenta]|uniref:Uncharacterized protein n=1 Tax=Colocasia esculenta TaxID=4460 RepID=A0A843UD52_COLES|nr:hypothetical protein [Colocasia esculenta]